jgi:hypothetical protein
MKSILKSIGRGIKSFANFIYSLFFTRDDDLDVLQLLFTAIVLVTLLVAWKVTTETGMSDAVKTEGLITLRWLTGLLVVTAVPKWLVPAMIQSKSNLMNQVSTAASLQGTSEEWQHTDLPIQPPEREETP